MLRVIKYRAARPRIQHFITAMAAEWPVLLLQCSFAAKGKSLEIFLCSLADILLNLFGEYCSEFFQGQNR
jgi:hypothetical protein